MIGLEEAKVNLTELKTINNKGSNLSPAKKG